MELLGFYLWHQTTDAGRAKPAPSTEPVLPAEPVLRIPAVPWWTMLLGALVVGPAALIITAQSGARLPAFALWSEPAVAGIALAGVHATLRNRGWVRLLLLTVPLFFIGQFLALFVSACVDGCV